MKKFIFTAVLTLALMAQSYAQSAYFLYNEGAKLTIANTDAKGKHTGYSTLEVKEVVGSRSGCWAGAASWHSAVIAERKLDN